MEDGNSSSSNTGQETPSSSTSTVAASSSSPSSSSSRRCVLGLGLAASVALLLLAFVTVQPSTRPTIMYKVLGAKYGALPSPPPPVLLTDSASFHPETLEFVWQPQRKVLQEQQELEGNNTSTKEAQITTSHGEGVAICDLVVKGHDFLPFDEPVQGHACLRNKSIVMVGDSLTRYQYLNLVQFLENGQWWNPDPQLECEFQWNGWPSFYNGTNARFNGREICDCYREEPAGRSGNIENRFYYNEAADVWVSFFQWFNVECGHQGHDLGWLNVAVPPSRRRRAQGRHTEKRQQQQQQQQQQLRAEQANRPPRGLQTGCAPGACNNPSHWSHDIYGLLEQIVPQLHPDVLILNSGHWGRLPGAYDLDKLTQAAKAAVRVSGGRVIYKTTTAPNAPAPFIPEDDLAEHFMKEGLSILDAGAITFASRDVAIQLSEKEDSHLMWDMLHYFSPVYAGLNQILLNYICPAL